jgi:hypothetical protein
MATPNFELVTELQTTTRRDFPLADLTALAPLNSNALLDGEWLELDSNYKLARGAAGAGLVPAYVVHTERGRYDTQAIGKVNVIMLGMYEAETKIVDTTSLVIGSPLIVTDVNTQGYASRRGLAIEGATAGRMLVGYVSKLPGGGKVRFVHFGYQKR